METTKMEHTTLLSVNKTKRDRYKNVVVLQMLNYNFNAFNKKCKLAIEEPKKKLTPEKYEKTQP